MPDINWTATALWVIVVLLSLILHEVQAARRDWLNQTRDR